jgi:hypothetical protein
MKQDIMSELKELEALQRKVNRQLKKMIASLGCPKAMRVVDTERRGLGSPQEATAFTDKAILELMASFSFHMTNPYLLIPPSKRMLPETWRKIKSVIENNGGRWVTRKNHFVFKSHAQPIFDAMFAQGKVINKKKDAQAFYTPAKVAAQVAGYLDCNGYVVLEPSAGEGALADACMRAGAHSIICIENDPAAVAVLKVKGYVVHEKDFLATSATPGQRRIAMNPPFARGQATTHICHALKMLLPGGRLVAIMPGTTPSIKLRAALDDGIKHGTISKWDCTCLGAKAFRESGTDVTTSILVVHK